jgi:hypothetical protein
MSGILSQLGVIKESTYNTPLAVTRFFEFNKESIVGKYDRIESAGLRAGTRVQRSDRWVPNPKGAGGSLELEVQSKGFGFWLEQMLGSVASGSLTDSNSPHTGSVASLNGKSFTLQVGRPDITQTVNPFTYGGGKVMSWELSNNVDGLLLANLDLDFASEVDSGSTPYTLQSASYPTTSQLMSYIKGSFKVGGVETSVKDISIKCDNGLDGDRFFIRTASGQKEQVESTMRKITVDVTAEFESLTHFNAVSAVLPASAVAGLTAQWFAPTLTGTSTYPNLLATMTAGRYDKGGPVVDSGKILEQKLSFQVLYDGTNSAIALAYTTPDTTP